MKKFNISFKKHLRETGLAGMGSGYVVDIKVNKHIVGSIKGPDWRTKDNLTTIWLKVKSNSGKCAWKNTSLKKKFVTEDEARIFLKENLKKIYEKSGLFGYCGDCEIIDIKYTDVGKKLMK